MASEVNSLKLTNENGSFIREVHQQILIPANCGVAGHFRFQENGGNCMMCQRTAVIETENKRLRQEEQHFLDRQEAVKRAIQSIWPRLQGQLKDAICAAALAAVASKKGDDHDGAR